MWLTKEHYCTWMEIRKAPKASFHYVPKSSAPPAKLKFHQSTQEIEWLSTKRKLSSTAAIQKPKGFLFPSIIENFRLNYLHYQRVLVKPSSSTTSMCSRRLATIWRPCRSMSTKRMEAMIEFCRCLELVCFSFLYRSTSFVWHEKQVTLQG